MRRLKQVGTRLSEGINTTELQQRIQKAFNRYHASVQIKDTAKGIVVRVSSIPKAKLAFSELREMYAKVDRVVDGTYAEIFEVRAAWVEANATKGIDLVLDFGFEGERASLKVLSVTDEERDRLATLDYNDLLRAVQSPSTPAALKRDFAKVLALSGKAQQNWEKLFAIERQWDALLSKLQKQGFTIALNFRDFGA